MKERSKNELMCAGKRVLSSLTRPDYGFFDRSSDACQRRMKTEHFSPVEN
jgi:hypothetical protein